MSHYTLEQLALYNLEKIAAEMEKVAFEPMPGGQPPAPPQGAPMDPNAGGPPQGGPPVDPNMMAGGGAPAASPPPPPAAPAAPAPASPDMDAMVQAVRQVMMEMGGQGQGQGQGKGGKGGDMEERLSAIESALAQVLQQLNLASPDQAVADAVSANAKAKPGGDVMSAGSGQPDPGQGAVAASGPMDPNAGALMSQMKLSSYRPLDGGLQPSNKLVAALKRARAR